MMIAVISQEESRKLLVLGLMDENIKRLLDDRPIFKDLEAAALELEGWSVCILGPEDTARFVAQVGG